MKTCSEESLAFTLQCIFIDSEAFWIDITSNKGQLALCSVAEGPYPGCSCGGPGRPAGADGGRLSSPSSCSSERESEAALQALTSAVINAESPRRLRFLLHQRENAARCSVSTPGCATCFLGLWGRGGRGEGGEWAVCLVSSDGARAILR